MIEYLGSGALEVTEIFLTSVIRIGVFLVFVSILRKYNGVEFAPMLSFIGIAMVAMTALAPRSNFHITLGSWVSLLFSVLVAAWLYGVWREMKVIWKDEVKLRRIESELELVKNWRIERIFWYLNSRFKISRKVRIYWSKDGHLPAYTWGAFPARICIDKRVLALSDREIMMILAHELAHIKEFHYAILLTARIMESLYRFFPFESLFIEQLRRELEFLADARVAKVLSYRKRGRNRYAAFLCDLVDQFSGNHSLRPTALAMTVPLQSVLYDRIKELLKEPTSDWSQLKKQVLFVPVIFFSAFLVEIDLSKPQVKEELVLRNENFEARVEYIRDLGERNSTLTTIDVLSGTPVIKAVEDAENVSSSEKPESGSFVFYDQTSSIRTDATVYYNGSKVVFKR